MFVCVRNHHEYSHSALQARVSTRARSQLCFTARIPEASSYRCPKVCSRGALGQSPSRPLHHQPTHPYTLSCGSPQTPFLAVHRNALTDPSGRFLSVCVGAPIEIGGACSLSFRDGMARGAAPRVVKPRSKHWILFGRKGVATTTITGSPPLPSEILVQEAPSDGFVRARKGSRGCRRSKGATRVQHTCGDTHTHSSRQCCFVVSAIEGPSRTPPRHKAMNSSRWRGRAIESVAPSPNRPKCKALYRRYTCRTRFASVSSTWRSASRPLSGDPYSLQLAAWIPMFSVSRRLQD